MIRTENQVLQFLKGQISGDEGHLNFEPSQHPFIERRTLILNNVNLRYLDQLALAMSQLPKTPPNIKSKLELDQVMVTMTKPTSWSKTIFQVNQINIEHDFMHT